MVNKKTSTSNKKSKDPKAPKRHRSAYILFSIDKRQQIKIESPGLTSKEIISELGALWKIADSETKQRFQKLSDTEKAEYEAKSNAYKNSKNTKKQSPTKSQPIEQNQSMEVNSSQ